MTGMPPDWSVCLLGGRGVDDPLHLEVNKLVTINDQPIQFGVGARYYADAPDGGPEWGLRINFVLLFPKG